MARSEPMAAASLPDMRARSRPGTAIAAMMPMIATTISSSMRVKPSFFCIFFTSNLLECARAGRARGCYRFAVPLRRLCERPTKRQLKCQAQQHFKISCKSLQESYLLRTVSTTTLAALTKTVNNCKPRFVAMPQIVNSIPARLHAIAQPPMSKDRMAPAEEGVRGHGIAARLHGSSEVELLRVVPERSKAHPEHFGGFHLDAAGALERQGDVMAIQVLAARLEVEPFTEIRERREVQQRRGCGPGFRDGLSGAGAELRRK